MKQKLTSSLRNLPLPKRPEKPKYCGFCKSEAVFFDYANPTFLIRACLNEQGKILPPRYTGHCRKHQKKMAQAVKRARHIGVLPYETDNLR